MFHVLKDEEQVVAVLANVTPELISDAVAKVDAAFRRWIDVDFLNVERHMCEDLGVAYSTAITDYNDVLVALLVDGGATEVEWRAHDTTPEVLVRAEGT